MAQILKRNAGAYIARHPRQAAPQVQSTLAKLSLCRTAALGERTYRCSRCATSSVVYNSCGDRYCPTCNGARRSDWLESTRGLIFDGVDHFQVVFTLPSELSSLALGNRKPIYNLLFAASWETLKETIGSEHGYDAAAVMVLHTWNQKLDAHAHVHAVVPGCGPAIDGSGIAFAQRDGDVESRGRYLVDAVHLRTLFRDTFLRGLDRLHKRGQLNLTGQYEALQTSEHWQTLLRKLQEVNWVSFIQAPPRPGLSAEPVLKYLARYLAGGPISDNRIKSTDQSNVTLMARTGEVTGGQRKQVPITLSQVEFTRRWSLHVLPSGFTRTRRFGGWSNSNRAAYLERFAQQLDATDVPLAEDAAEFGPFEESGVGQEDGEIKRACQSCRCALIPQGQTTRPSWAKVMASTYRPRWYQRC